MLRALLLALLFLLAACSREPQPVKVDIPGAPALWKVSGARGTAWLFGSVHQLPPDMDWQTPEFDRAVRQADSLVLEASGLDDEKAVAQIFAQMAVSGGLPLLRDRIDPALRPVLDQLEAPIPGPHAMFDHMESWAAALTLASAMNSDLGLSQGAGVERTLTLRFRTDGKAVTGLETISQQFGFFDSLAETEQRKMLEAILHGAAHNRQDFEKMLATWIRGDADAVLDDQSDSILASPALREALLDGRNRNWAKQVSAMIEKGQRPFVAVGAGHMAGKGGVPALLAAAGYPVVRVQ